MSAPVPGAVPVAGFIGPTYDTDVHAVIDPFWGIDGLRSVDTLSTRDAITLQRRRYGMLVFVQANGHYYQMQADLLSWTDFGTSLGGGGSSSTPKKETFTPTQGQLSYVLSQTPIVDSVAFILNGQELHEGTEYTVSGNTVTLDSLFGVGQDKENLTDDTISIRYLY